MTDSTDRVIASIDETLDGYVSGDVVLSGDAMRWSAEEPEHARVLRAVQSAIHQRNEAMSTALEAIGKALNKNFCNPVVIPKPRKVNGANTGVGHEPGSAEPAMTCNNSDIPPCATLPWMSLCLTFAVFCPASAVMPSRSRGCGSGSPPLKRSQN